MTVFNADKTANSYTLPQLFCGDQMGLLDTINHHHPKLWHWYKEMKSLDWSEDEFDFAKCLPEFESGDPVTVDFMLKTLLWQWEADSVASRAPAPLIAPFCSSTDLWCAELRITDNEVVHAATYSEIVRLSFGKPKEVLEQMLNVRETMQRLEFVARELDDFERLSHEYALKIHKETDDEVLQKIIKFYFIMLLLERVQFMASFAVTFTICRTKIFQPIGMAVRKIAQDELEVHVEFRKAVLEYIRSTEKGKIAFDKCKPEMVKFLQEVVNSEMSWCDYLFTDQETGLERNLTGTNRDKLKQWVLYNAYFVDEFAGLGGVFEYPKTNPMPHLMDWFNVSAFQAAPQEQINNQYRIVTVSDDVVDDDLNIL